MRAAIFLVLAFFGCFSFSSADTRFSQRDVAVLADILKGRYGHGQKLNDRAIRTPWTTILNGLLRSQNFASVAASTPCDIVNQLENDAEAAEQFVQELQAGQVPSIIQDLPSEVVDAFGAMIHVALSLPQAIWDTAENTVDGFENVFDSIADGSIVSELPAEIADAWETVTAGFVDAWDAATADIACLFEDCPAPTPGGCASSVPASAYASATPAVYYNTTSAAYSYNWGLSSAVAAASAAAYAQATASESSLHPVAIGTSFVPGATSVVMVTHSASSQPSVPTQAYSDGAPPARRGQGILWMVASLTAIGGLVLWL